MVAGADRGPLFGRLNPICILPSHAWLYCRHCARPPPPAQLVLRYDPAEVAVAIAHYGAMKSAFALRETGVADANQPRSCP